MSKYSTNPKFLTFERLFGETAVGDLLERIFDVYAHHGDGGGDGISLSVTQTSMDRFTFDGYLDYAGQEMTFNISWGHGHGTEVLEFDFDEEEVLRLRRQMWDNAKHDEALGWLLTTVLKHGTAALRQVNLLRIPSPSRERGAMRFDSQRVGVCVPSNLWDPALSIGYPFIAQCQMQFLGEACQFSVGLAALHPDGSGDDELSQWPNAFASTRLVFHEASLNDLGLLDIEEVANLLTGIWMAKKRDVPLSGGKSTLAELEHEFAGRVLEACAP